MGVDGVTLAAVILSRPLMWLFIGYAVAVAVGCDRRTILVSLFVLAGLSIVCVVARQTAGPFLLGFTNVSLTGGLALTFLEESSSSYQGSPALLPTSSSNGDKTAPSPAVTVTLGDGVKLSPPSAARGWADALHRGGRSKMTREWYPSIPLGRFMASDWF